jgi:hypothetical protein
MMLFLEHKERKYPLYIVVKTPYDFNMYVFRHMLGNHVKYQTYSVMKSKKKGTGKAHISFVITICTLL